MAKIGIDARFFSDHATGIGKHTSELIKHLAKLDPINEYTIFLRPEQYDRYQPPNPRFQKKKTTARHYSWAEQTQFLRELNTENLDLMVFPQFNAPLLYRRPFVVTIHDLTLHKFPGKKKTDFLSRLAYKILIKSVCRRARHCFAVSENTKKDMIEILGVSADKITVTYNGVSQRFKPLPNLTNQQPNNEPTLASYSVTQLPSLKKYGLPENYFLYTGVMRSHKNILGMIEAYQRFLNFQKSKNQEPNPKNQIPSLVIAGPQDTIYFPEIQDRCRYLGLKINEAPGVFFPGFLDEEDINVVMAHAKAFVFPSFYEGFGIPPLEAMQCGVPTLTAKTSSLPEACGEATLYFDPYDTRDMAQAMERIWQDEVLRTELVTKGFQQCRKFSWEEMTRKMLERYRKILDPPS